MEPLREFLREWRIYVSSDTTGNVTLGLIIRQTFQFRSSLAVYVHGRDILVLLWRK